MRGLRGGSVPISLLSGLCQISPNSRSPYRRQGGVTTSWSPALLLSLVIFCSPVTDADAHFTTPASWTILPSTIVITDRIA